MGNVSAFTTKYNSRQPRLINEAYIISGSERMHTDCAQWDTGATKTCVSKAVVDRLGLTPIGWNMARTPAGERMLPVFLVDILLRNNVIVKDVQVMGSEIGGQGIDILIGMDIIGIGDFAVTNANGSTVFSFRIPSVEEIDFCKEHAADESGNG